MILLTRITRFGLAIRQWQEQDRLKDAAGQVQGTFAIDSLEELEARAADWERRAGESTQAQPGIAVAGPL